MGRQRDIKEVWDYRLSTAVPTIYNLPGQNWRVEITSKSDSNAILGKFDTGIKSTPEDNFNDKALDACYKWLRSVRDKYAHKDIDKIKIKFQDLR